MEGREDRLQLPSNAAASFFQGPVVLTFQEDGLEAAELVLSQVCSFQKSATTTVRKPSPLQRPAPQTSTPPQSAATWSPCGVPRPSARETWSFPSVGRLWRQIHGSPASDSKTSFMRLSCNTCANMHVQTTAGGGGLWTAVPPARGIHGSSPLTGVHGEGGPWRPLGSGPEQQAPLSRLSLYLREL